MRAANLSLTFDIGPNEPNVAVMLCGSNLTKARSQDELLFSSSRIVPDAPQSERTMMRGFSIEHGSNYMLVDVCSHVDTASAEAFRSALRTCKESALPYFIVDLSSCRYIDSTGLGMLVTHHRNHENLIVIVPDGTSFKHPNIPPSLAGHLNFVPTREAALALTRAQHSGGTAA